MLIKFGNLSPEEFAAKVDADFTPQEIATLHEHWSREATLTGPEQFHVFDDPGISVSVGSATAGVLAVFTAANARSTFTREVPFHVDDAWTR